MALLLRSFWQLSHVDAGYDTKDIFTFQIAARRADLTSMSGFQYTFMDRLKGIPGVESVGYITTLPLDEGAAAQSITTSRIEASGAEAKTPGSRTRTRSLRAGSGGPDHRQLHGQMGRHVHHAGPGRH